MPNNRPVSNCMPIDDIKHDSINSQDFDGHLFLTMSSLSKHPSKQKQDEGREKDNAQKNRC